ncbi:SAM-dependent methyltransferase [Candidatus Trichorickettsia mobilis]|uniref:SAM-dependent methyltransferase n=1 Tax=Candidatus Trichorickettsia mobilis TaxID=1346319 RepID=A0ABZ0UUV8_9RICK|nr:class I SAM-dependent methyltransferase [Candidatus Trichorickettsia mobilis]WPY00773.1 SAM-dependent methyltransferase [Candidatus Trichorickettsia mobilis]
MKDLLVVQEQYQEYPYPLRYPEDENKRLISTIGDCLAALNHYLYCGKEDFKSGFRVLVAGGGTGDASTFLGEQLKNTNAEIIYLDFSKASMEIAQKRAEVRGLKNITWIHDSILNIPKLALGKFDFINCCGVLHHLASPDEGLKILNDSLSMRGGMHLMIYAKYGREGVYQIQNLMRLINSNVHNKTQEIINCKALLGSLPDTNWFKKSKELYHDHAEDGGLYDLLLHKQDRAYSIPEMYEFVNNAGLHFVEFSMLESLLLLESKNYIRNSELLLKVKNKDVINQQAIYELITGKITKHEFFVSIKQETVASIADLDNIPYFYYNTSYIPKHAYDYIENNKLVAGMNVNFSFNIAQRCNINLLLCMSEYTKYIFKNMIDGTKSLQEIFDAIRQELNRDLSDELLINEAKIALTPFFEAGILFLRHKSIAPYIDYAAEKL